MDASVEILALLAFAGVTLILLLPVHVAWYVAWKAGPTFPSKKHFVLVCTLMTYGVPGLVGVLFVPIELIGDFLVPQWHTDGNELVGPIIAVLLEVATYIAVFGGVVASFAVPVKLKPKWPHIPRTSG